MGGLSSRPSLRAAAVAQEPDSPQLRLSRWRSASEQTPPSFSLINTIMLRTLAVHDPRSLVISSGRRVDRPHALDDCLGPDALVHVLVLIFLPDVPADSRRATAFSGVFAFFPGTNKVNVDGRTTKSSGLFRVG